MNGKRYQWWHGVAFYVGVRLVSYGLRALVGKVADRNQAGSHQEDRKFYRNERLPVFAPPTIAFPVAWGINSVSAVAGGIHVLNLPANTPGRDEFIRSQAAAWVLFASFEAAYFGLRSPINAAIITVLYSAATAASVDAALRQMGDKAAASSLGSTVVWLALANAVGITTALWNRDPFWNAGPFADPDPSWVKRPALSA